MLRRSCQERQTKHTPHTRFAISGPHLKPTEDKPISHKPVENPMIHLKQSNGPRSPPCHFSHVDPLPSQETCCAQTLYGRANTKRCCWESNVHSGLAVAGLCMHLALNDKATVARCVSKVELQKLGGYAWRSFKGIANRVLVKCSAKLTLPHGPTKEMSLEGNSQNQDVDWESFLHFFQRNTRKPILPACLSYFFV